MGIWNTLHLFDVHEFNTQIIPCLRGEKGCFKNDYLDFLKSNSSEVHNLSKEDVEIVVNNSISSINEIANQFDLDFKKHNIYDILESHADKEEYIRNIKIHYDFTKFLEYYIFKYCADFFPHTVCGKRGLLNNFDLKENSISYEILKNLDDDDNFFNGYGIVNWISTEDTEILLNSKKDFILNYNNDYFEDFFKIVEIAVSNNLGLIRGKDMNEWNLEKLPQYKLISKNEWNKYKFHWILFE